MANYEVKDGVGIIEKGTNAIKKEAFYEGYAFNDEDHKLKSVTIPDSVT